MYEKGMKNKRKKRIDENIKRNQHFKEQERIKTRKQKYRKMKHRNLKKF